MRAGNAKQEINLTWPNRDVYFSGVIYELCLNVLETIDISEGVNYFMNL